MVHGKGWCSSSCGGRPNTSLHKHMPFSTTQLKFHIGQSLYLKPNILIGGQQTYVCCGRSSQRCWYLHTSLPQFCGL